MNRYFNNIFMNLTSLTSQSTNNYQNFHLKFHNKKFNFVPIIQHLKVKSFQYQTSCEKNKDLKFCFSISWLKCKGFWIWFRFRKNSCCQTYRYLVIVEFSAFDFNQKKKKINCNKFYGELFGFERDWIIAKV